MRLCFSNVLGGGGSVELAQIFPTLDADWNALSKQMVFLDHNRVGGYPTESSVTATAAAAADDRNSLKLSVLSSGNATPSSPCSDSEIKTCDATRGGSTFDVVNDDYSVPVNLT